MNRCTSCQDPRDEPGLGLCGRCEKARDYDAAHARGVADGLERAAKIAGDALDGIDDGSVDSGDLIAALERIRALVSR